MNTELTPRDGECERNGDETIAFFFARLINALQHETLTPTPLPCPFCGGTDVFVTEGTTQNWRLVVCSCGASSREVRHNAQAEDEKTAEAFSYAAAIKAWNTGPERHALKKILHYEMALKLIAEQADKSGNTGIAALAHSVLSNNGN